MLEVIGNCSNVSDESTQTDESKTDQKFQIIQELCGEFVSNFEKHSAIMKEQANSIATQRKSIEWNVNNFRDLFFEMEKQNKSLADRVAALENQNLRLKALFTEQ